MVDFTSLPRAQEHGDYDVVIAGVRDAMSTNPAAAMADPFIRDWIGRRFRNIFIDEASASAEVVAKAQKPAPLSWVDRRDDRQKIADRFFRTIDAGEVHTEMPAAEPGAFSDVSLLICPGLLTGFMPGLAFQQEIPKMTERFGVNILSADSHPVRSCEANVADLTNAMVNGIGNAPDLHATLLTSTDDPVPPGDVVMLGYSKGGPDINTFLVARPDLAHRVKAIISWAGAHGGSYLANDLYTRFKKVPDSEMVKHRAANAAELVRRMLPFADVKRIDRRLDEYDVKGALYSLSTGGRDEWNEANTAALDELAIPTIYFTGATTAREVTYFNLEGELELDKYDVNNDMQLTQAEATPPTRNSVHAAMFHATHWDLSYDPWPWYETAGSRELHEPFPRYAALASILLLLSELGIMR